MQDETQMCIKKPRLKSRGFFINTKTDLTVLFPQPGEV